MTLIMVATSALNVKVVQNKRGLTARETMTLKMVATSALNVKSGSKQARVNGKSNHDPRHPVH